jgi:dipeptidyl aminopeptidase/acylaminoacyl peptidase
LTASDGWYVDPAWSSDGITIACSVLPAVRGEPRHGQVATIDVATGARTILTADLDRNCTPYPPVRGPIWRGDDILFSIEDRGDTALHRVAANGSGPPQRMLGGPFTLTGMDVLGGTIVHTASTTTAPSRLLNGDEVLHDASARIAGLRTLAPAERFTAVSPDGSEVDAWILRPPGVDPDEPRPTLLAIHGGPFTQFGSRFVDELQVYAGAGYVVLYSNPRGSSGSTEAWGRAICGPALGGGGWGSVDHDDLMAVVDEGLRRFPCCDPDRLGVMGGSYGGYMTSWIVGHTDRFRCGVSERAVNAMASLWGQSDFGPFLGDQFGATPYTDPELYRRMSPVVYADRITTPLLILHSENDLRCPIGQAEELFRALRSLKREVEFVRFPDEGHELSRSGSPAHRVMRLEVILEFLDRHLSAAARPG